MGLIEVPLSLVKSAAVVSGIYEIKCLANNKRYIGQAANVASRLQAHKRTLRQRRHPNRNLQASWNKYGEKRFAFRLVLMASANSLTMYEQIVADFYRSEGLFNYGAHVDSGKRGRKLSQAARKRIKAAVNTPEARAKKLLAIERKLADPAYRATHLEGCKNGWRGNDARRAKVSAAISTARNNPSKKKAWNAALRAAKNTPEYLAKVTGQKRSAATRAKISAAKKRYWARKRKNKNAGVVGVPVQ